MGGGPRLRGVQTGGGRGGALRSTEAPSLGPHSEMWALA